MKTQGPECKRYIIRIVRTAKQDPMLEDAVVLHARRVDALSQARCGIHSVGVINIIIVIVTMRIMKITTQYPKDQVCKCARDQREILQADGGRYCSRCLINGFRVQDCPNREEPNDG